MELRLIRFPDEEIKKTEPPIKCSCGKTATTQLEIEYDQLANPVVYFCDKCADILSKKHNIPLMRITFYEMTST